jgi:hypothetical protein
VEDGRDFRDATWRLLIVLSLPASRSVQPATTRVATGNASRIT